MSGWDFTSVDRHLELENTHEGFTKTLPLECVHPDETGSSVSIKGGVGSNQISSTGN